MIKTILIYTSIALIGYLLLHLLAHSVGLKVKNTNLQNCEGAKLKLLFRFFFVHIT